MSKEQEIHYLQTLLKSIEAMKPPQGTCKVCLTRFVKVDEAGICGTCHKYGL